MVSRPKCTYAVAFRPKVKKFIPEGACPVTTGVILFSPAEVEALRLKHLQHLCQTRAAGKMGVSQSSFQRLLSVAQRKAAEAIVQGKFISLGATSAAARRSKK